MYQGREELLPVFKEYARYFKGRHQLTCSSGLRKRLLGDEQEKTDEELAAEEREQAVLLGRLTRRQWHIVLANDVRGELLEVAHSGDWQQVTAFLALSAVTSRRRNPPMPSEPQAVRCNTSFCEWSGVG